MLISPDLVNYVTSSDFHYNTASEKDASLEKKAKKKNK